MSTLSLTPKIYLKLAKWESLGYTACSVLPPGNTNKWRERMAAGGANVLPSNGRRADGNTSDHPLCDRTQECQEPRPYYTRSGDADAILP